MTDDFRNPPQHHSFRLTRPGQLPEHRIKPHLMWFDTLYRVTSVMILVTCVVAGLFLYDACLRAFLPAGGPIDIQRGVPCFLLVSAGMVLSFNLLKVLERILFKAIMYRSGRCTPDEIDSFPIETGGRIWRVTSTKHENEPWPAEWQEEVPDDVEDKDCR